MLILDLPLKLAVADFHFLGVLKVHPEDLEPVAKEKGEDRQKSSDSYHNARKRILKGFFRCACLVVEGRLVLNIFKN